MPVTFVPSTLKEMLEPASVTLIVFVVINCLQATIQIDPRVPALFLAEMLLILGTYIKQTGEVDRIAYVAAMLNGMLIFFTSGVVTSVIGRVIGAGPIFPSVLFPSPRKRGLFSAWF